MGGKRNKRKRRAERQKDSASAESKNKRQKKEKKSDDMSSSACLVFQDVMKPFLKKSKHDGENEDEEVSLAFFELANSPCVGFRVNEDDDNKPVQKKAADCIVLKQDTDACGNHTGGIVWETAYLLLQYILSTKRKLGNTLEVGSGCGLVGQVLAAKKVADKVVMTEHADVVPNLIFNVDQNQAILKNGATLQVSHLDWEKAEEEAEKSQHLKPHSFDTILGTDVVFTPKLVEPLWNTLKLMSHSKTNIFLCLQERCAASHKLLVEKAPSYKFRMEDITDQIDSIQSCRWGRALECRLFHITVVK